MQTGSLAWWMAVDRARERAEAAGLLAPPATLMPGTWRGSPYLLRWDHEAASPGPMSAASPAPAVPVNGGTGSASGMATHRVELVREPLLRGQLRLIRQQARKRQGLDADDFALLWRCLQGRDALGFFRASSNPRSVHGGIWNWHRCRCIRCPVFRLPTSCCKPICVMALGVCRYGLFRISWRRLLPIGWRSRIGAAASPGCCTCACDARCKGNAGRVTATCWRPAAGCGWCPTRLARCWIMPG